MKNKILVILTVLVLLVSLFYSQVEAEDKKPTAAEYITSLYDNAEKTVVTANAEYDESGHNVIRTIDYNYAPSVSLMKDRYGGEGELDSGNLRYYGINPNNFIDIGDKTTGEIKNWKTVPFTANIETREECLQRIAELSSVVQEYTIYDSADELCSVRPIGTPILWRIIGIFDGKIKVARYEMIGDYAIDTSSENINDGNGLNEWSQADAMKLLNSGYDNNEGLDQNGNKILVNNSLYWNRGKGNCYIGPNNESAECDFTAMGLADSAKKNLVNQRIYLGRHDLGDNSYKIYFANEVYVLERRKNDEAVINGVKRTSYWDGKVGIITSSDYGYSTDLGTHKYSLYISSITDTYLFQKQMEWADHYYTWLLSPASNEQVKVIFPWDGYITTSATSESNLIRPTLMLNPTVTIKQGDGSKTNPYVLDELEDNDTTNDYDKGNVNIELKTSLKSANADGDVSVKKDDVLEYNATLSNKGNNTSYDNAITIEIPEYFDYVEESASEKVEYITKKKELIWQIEELDKGTERTLSFRIKSSKDLDNVGEIELKSSIKGNSEKIDNTKTGILLSIIMLISSIIISLFLSIKYFKNKPIGL